jgi:Outer membrane protein beta-barrel domain
MKRITKYGYKAMLASFFALSLGLGSLLAQPTSTDTTEISIGRKVITITKDSLDKRDVHVETVATGDDSTSEKKEIKRIDVDLLNFDIGTNFMTTGQSFNLPSDQSNLEIIPMRSTHLAFHTFKTRVNIAKGHFGIVTAITFDNNRFQWRNGVSMLPNQDSLTFIPDSIGLEKNKLITWHAQVPLLLSFQTNPTEPKKNFHISVGGYAGLLIGSKLKQKSDLYGKVEQKDDFNLANFRYGLTARVGFGKLEVYANYSLSPLFNEGEAPAINPVNFGISLTGIM